MDKLKLNTIKSILKPRVAESHKGNYGHALLIAGSEGKMGAAVIAAKACLRSGVGLLTVNVPFSEKSVLPIALPEAMLNLRENTIDLSHFSAIGIGPGLGTSNEAKKLLDSLLKETNIPVLLDADALNLIAADKEILKYIPEGSVLTPHPKEFDRLFGNHKSTEDRIATTIQKAKELNVVIVLKGHQTLITYNGESVLNTTGNAGLAKGGSGDALTGIITSFLAQGYSPFDAAKLGVYIHGLAADLSLKNQSMESVLILDIIENLGKAFHEISR